MAQAHDLRRDPTGAPACSTRRRMAWVCIVAATIILALSAWRGGDGAVGVAAVWGAVALAAIGIAAYAMSRAALDRTIAGLIERLPR